MVDWQYKADVLNALSRLEIGTRGIGNWWASCYGVEIKTGGMLGSPHGNGDTPQTAIEDYWDKVVVNLDGDYLVVNAMRDTRFATRWNGYMWERIPE